MIIRVHQSWLCGSAAMPAYIEAQVQIEKRQAFAHRWATRHALGMMYPGIAAGAPRLPPASSSETEASEP